MEMQRKKMEKDKMMMEKIIATDLKSWPEASQIIAKDMMSKYGKPNETIAKMLVW